MNGMSVGVYRQGWEVAVGDRVEMRSERVQNMVVQATIVGLTAHFVTFADPAFWLDGGEYESRHEFRTRTHCPEHPDEWAVPLVNLPRLVRVPA